MPSKRSSSTISPSTDLSPQPVDVTDVLPLASATSPQIVVLYGGRKRAYSQDLLAILRFEQVLDLLQEDFGVYDVQPTRMPCHQVFYVTQRDHAVPMMVDAKSWAELKKNVTKIEVQKPKAKHTFLYILLAICLFLLYFLFFAEPSKTAEHLRRGYHF